VVHVGSKVSGHARFIKAEVYQQSERATDFIHQKLKDGKPSSLMRSIGETKSGKEWLQMVRTILFFN
jgi:hypothetical protein